MSLPSSPSQANNLSAAKTLTQSPGTGNQEQPSYVKLAMRNMVRKGGISLKHFALTTIILLTVLVGLSYLTR